MCLFCGCLRHRASTWGVVIHYCDKHLACSFVQRHLAFCSWQRQTFGGSFVVGSLRFGVHMGERLRR